MSGKTILIADDDRQFLWALTVRLQAAGFEVIATQDAYQAVALARRDRPDLLLLDVNMPAGDGFSVQQRIDSVEELALIPVIYITGSSEDEVDRTAKSLGAFAVLHKPFETERLLETIRGALGYWVQAA